MLAVDHLCSRKQQVRRSRKLNSSTLTCRLVGYQKVALVQGQGQLVNAVVLNNQINDQRFSTLGDIIPEMARNSGVEGA